MSLWGKLIGRGRASAADGTGRAQPAATPSSLPAAPVGLGADTAQTRRLAELDPQIGKSPPSAQAWYAKAEALAELGRHEEALAGYNRALELDPRLAMALRGKALVLRTMHKSAEALVAVELALQVDPSLALAWRAKGAILRDLGRDAGGLICYEKGLAIDPRDALLWNNKGNVLLGLGRVVEAQASFMRALSIDPELADALKGMRSSYFTRSFCREYLVDGRWSSSAPESSIPPHTERLNVAVSNIDDVKRWLSVLGFELRQETSYSGSSSTLSGGEHFDHRKTYKTSLWLDSCCLGDWGTSGDHEVEFTFEPDAGADHGGQQYDGWNRLAELLASNVTKDPPPAGQSVPGVAPTKDVAGLQTARELGVPGGHSELKWSQAAPTFDLRRVVSTATKLTVSSYSSRAAEPEETYGNLLTGGSTREEERKTEFEKSISDEIVIAARLEANGYRLTHHPYYERGRYHSCSIASGDRQVGHMKSYSNALAHSSTLSITLYRDAAAYPMILDILRS